MDKEPDMTQHNEKPVEIRMLAVSLAGHDKGKTYAVVGEEGAYVFLCDGKHRLLSKPKRKKRMHIQAVTHLEACFGNPMLLAADDSDIRRILKAYANRDVAVLQNDDLVQEVMHVKI